MNADKLSPKESAASDRYNIPQDDPVDFDESDFFPTDAVPGSAEKLKVMAYRYRNGFPLWHENDRLDYSGIGMLTGENLSAARITSANRKKADNASQHAETPPLQVLPLPGENLEVPAEEAVREPDATSIAGESSVVESAETDLSCDCADAEHSSHTHTAEEHCSADVVVTRSTEVTLTMPAVQPWSAMPEEIQRLYKGLENSVAEGLLDPAELVLFLREAGIET